MSEQSVYRCDGGCGYTSSRPGRCPNCDYGAMVPAEPDAVLSVGESSDERET